MDAILLSVCLVLAAVPQGQSKDTCDVIPKDPYIENGSDIKILFNKTCNEYTLNSHSKLYWLVNKKKIDERYYETNFTFTSVTISNVNLRTTVEIYGYVQGQDQVLSGTIIRTFHKPRNIICVTHISESDFVCHWEHKIQPIYHWEHKIQPPLKVNYTVFRQSQSGRITTCRSNRKLCSFKSLPLLGAPCIITVKAKSPLWETSSDPLELDLWNTVKIDPPENVRAVPVLSYLKVHWKIPSDNCFPSQVIHCQVKYNQHVINTSMYDCPETTAVTTGELKPCTNHTVAVRCALELAVWSDWSKMLTVLSNYNVSGVQLNLWRKIGPPDDSGRRRVHLMWKGISPTCNAIDGYKLKYMVDEKLVSSSLDKSYFYVDQKANNILLAAFRGNTTFREHSIYVPAIGESLCQFQAQVSARDGDIHVSWSHPDCPVSGYMIDWTSNGDTYNWIQSQDTNFSLLGMPHYILYNITVTPLYDGKAGMGQELQICSKQKAPDYKLSVEVHAEHQSAQVKWTAVAKHECSGDVVNYTVFYKTGDEPELNIKMNSSIQEVRLEHLQTATKYRVHVMVSAVTGTTNSSFTHFQTAKYDLNVVIIICIICGITLLVLLFTGLCFVSWWKRFMKKMVPNPGMSSLVFWSNQNFQETQLFNSPPQPETVQKIYYCKLDTNRFGPTYMEDEDSETAIDQTDGKSSGFGSSSSYDSQPREENTNLSLSPTELPLLSEVSGGVNQVESETSDAFDLQAPVSCPINPYKVQHPGGCPVRVAGEEERLLLETRNRSPTASTPTYVTLAMLEHRKAGE
ncbi:hypothetical protein UPYG_G00275590 [Umbra pygmaea]|uniref:Fibronectin type-III domain-containing protein n=1 Tax=Umbra pygmaea TaxID=75934 RepID=A0ABD0W271_UMBPY